MNPCDWRQKIAKLSVRATAKSLGIKSPNCVLRYESGEREAPNSVAVKYSEISGGLVTGKDLDRVRKRFLRDVAKSKPAAA